jgi:hypothetical protein
MFLRNVCIDLQIQTAPKPLQQHDIQSFSSNHRITFLIVALMPTKIIVEQQYVPTTSLCYFFINTLSGHCCSSVPTIILVPIFCAALFLGHCCPNATRAYYCSTKSPVHASCLSSCKNAIERPEGTDPEYVLRACETVKPAWNRAVHVGFPIPRSKHRRTL